MKQLSNYYFLFAIFLTLHFQFSQSDVIDLWRMKFPNSYPRVWVKPSQDLHQECRISNECYGKLACEPMQMSNSSTVKDVKNVCQCPTSMVYSRNDILKCVPKEEEPEVQSTATNTGFFPLLVLSCLFLSTTR